MLRDDLRLVDELPHICDQIVKTYEEEAIINHIGLTPLPSQEAVVRIIETLYEIIYPGYFGEQRMAPTNVKHYYSTRTHELYGELVDQIYRALKHECKRLCAVCTHCQDRSEETAVAFLRRIPEVRAILAEDIESAYDGDPAAKSYDEIIFSYPCTYAITVYRLAHELLELGVPLIPRMMTEHAHTKTGIDIHPGAEIGRSFFIDHGTGVVIGETTNIGNNVKLYQGVTLGALSFPKDADGRLIRGKKRHPTIEDDVTIYAQATILGGRTVIGRGSVIGGNVWLTSSVPPYTIVTLEKPSLRFISKKEASQDYQI